MTSTGPTDSVPGPTATARPGTEGRRAEATERVKRDRRDGFSKSLRSRRSAVASLLYVLFSVCSAAIYYFVANMEASFFLTMGGMAQCLAQLFLALQACSDSAGPQVISGRSVFLVALSLACRLSSSTWLNGYLPADVTGDWFYQLVDCCALTLALFVILRLLRHGAKERKTASIDGQADKMWHVSSTLFTVVGALALGTLLRADMDRHPVFDSLWFTGHFLGAVAVAPQLFLLQRRTIHVKSNREETVYVNHYILAMALGQLLSATYMWWARNDIVCEPWVEGVNHSSWAILMAQVGHLLLVCDLRLPGQDIEQ